MCFVARSLFDSPVRRVLVAAGLLFVFSPWAVMAQSRPLVLIVHGRAQQWRDSAQVRREAFNALQDGARRIAGDPLIGEADVQLVWYADLLGSRAHTDDACSQLSTLTGAKRDVPVNAITFLAGIAGVLLDAAGNDSRSADSVDIRSLSGDLRYLADGDIRCASELRLAKSLDAARREKRPVILVSHSLGGLVSWDLLSHLASPDKPAVARWVTIGSPVASAEIRQLVFGDETPSLAVPSSVASWVNVIGTSDPFAIAVNDSVRTVPGVLDIRTEGEHSDPHQLTSYLSDAATLRAIFGGWCEAAKLRTQAAACARVQTSSSPRKSPPSR
jgi:pimeloyl-ACP methyl ester carboxylesterase